MSEEIKKNEAELNEATLEGVSGGYYLTTQPGGRAFEICNRCSHPRDGRCSKRTNELADYMRAHGLIDGEWDCPFYG